MVSPDFRENLCIQCGKVIAESERAYVVENGLICIDCDKKHPELANAFRGKGGKKTWIYIGGIVFVLLITLLMSFWNEFSKKKSYESYEEIQRDFKKWVKDQEQQREKQYYSKIKSTLDKNPELINAVDDYNQTMLHDAVYAGLKPVKYLIRHGADIEAKNFVGVTPLHIAASNGKYEIVKLLIKNGANIYSEDKWGGIPLEDTLSIFYHENNDANNMIITDGLERQKEFIKTVKLFLDKGVSANYCGKRFNRPLWYEAIYEGQKEIVEIFISYGADVNFKTDSKTGSGWTALHIAAFKGRKDIVELLIKSGADVNAKTTEGATPIGIAKYYGYNNIVDLLLKNGAKED